GPGRICPADTAFTVLVRESGSFALQSSAGHRPPRHSAHGDTVGTTAATCAGGLSSSDPEGGGIGAGSAVRSDRATPGTDEARAPEAGSTTSPVDALAESTGVARHVLVCPAADTPSRFRQRVVAQAICGSDGLYRRAAA